MDQHTGVSSRSRKIRVGVIQNGIQVDDAFNAIADAKLIRLIRTLPLVCLRYDVPVRSIDVSRSTANASATCLSSIDVTHPNWQARTSLTSASSGRRER